MNPTDTTPLLRLLGTVPTQSLSRGETLRAGISEAMICAAQHLDHIYVTSVDNTRNGEESSLAVLTLTDEGEEILDRIDESL